MNVKCTTRIERERGEYDRRFTAEEVFGFVEHLPSEAVITGIIREVGSQRDPERRMVGFVATWEREL